MKNRWRIGTLFLVGCMTLDRVFCGGDSGSSSSGGGSASGSEASGSGDSSEPAHLVMTFRATGVVPGEEDVHRVEDALNEILREKINAEIELVIIQSSSYAQQMTLMLSGSEQVDIMGANSAIVPTVVSAEQVRDLAPLLEEYGQGITELLGEDLMSCGEFNGVQYFIPIQADSALGMGYYVMRKDIVDKYNIDVSAIKTYDDLTEVFQMVHENEPNLTIVDPGSAGQSFMQYNCAWDKLGDYFGVLDNCGQDDLTVVNLFETENYINFVNVMREWYQSGFISADVTNSTESGAAKMRAGTLFCYASSNKPGINAQEQQNSGCEVVGAQVLDTITWTGNNWQWAIPETARTLKRLWNF